MQRARAPAAPIVDPLHSGMTPVRFVAMHVLGAVFPITAGLLVYGWRALGVMALVCGSALLSAMLWRRIGRRGARVGLEHVLWLSVLLSLSLPAHLFATTDSLSGTTRASWPLPIAAGMVLSMLVWVLGGAGSGRIHPVIVVYLILFVLFTDLLSPQFALKRGHLFSGDVTDVDRTNVRSVLQPGDPVPEASRQAWIISPAHRSDPYPSVRSIPPAQRIESFTTGYEAPERAWISLDSLVRDRLPPLEDLIVAGQPAAIGQGSAIAVIIGGLFLLYRGLIDHRVPLLIVLTALGALLVLPVPIIITEQERIWRWFISASPQVGWKLGLTFANYELMASPLMFTGFFLATSPSIRPLRRRAQTVYAVLIGLAAAVFQLYVSVSIGPYLALLAVGLVAPWVDQAFQQKTLV